MTDDDLEQLNRMRAIEVAVLAVPSEGGCPTSEQAAEWARARLEEHGLADLELRLMSGEPGCYRGRIVWETREVWVDRTGNQV